jgi:energy-coupling factor transport system ATP-binding protein
MIDVRDLSFQYPGSSSDVLHGVSFQIRDGSFTAIMGSNGSGKSTLARCLNGLLSPTAGSVTIDGHRTDENASVREIRRCVGMVFQDPNLQMTSFTVEREIAFGLENRGVDRAEMHRRVEEQLTEFHLSQYRDRPLTHLSAGEKQRVAISSVVVLQPRYLILDEATSLLSGFSRRAVIDLVRRLHDESGMAILLITQFPSESLNAGRLIVLHKGGVIADGDPAAVFDQDAERLHACGVPLPVGRRVALGL